MRQPTLQWPKGTRYKGEYWSARALIALAKVLGFTKAHDIEIQFPEWD